MDILLKVSIQQLNALDDALLAGEAIAVMADMNEKARFLTRLQTEVREIILAVYKEDTSMGPTGETVYPTMADPVAQLANSVRVRVTEDNGKSQLVFVQNCYELGTVAAKAARLNTFGEHSKVTVTDGVNTFRVTPGTCIRKTHE